MANKKKLTMNIVEKRLDFLLKELIKTQQATDYISKVTANYIEYKGDINKFQKYLEEIENDKAKSDSKESFEGNEKFDNRKSEAEIRNSES
jgi:hypothetical protein